MRTAEYAAEESYILYDIDLRRVFWRLIQWQLRDMNDPLGIVGRIPACSSEDNRAKTLSLLRSAHQSLLVAEEHEGKDDGAYWWAMTDVFGTDFAWPT
jgi:hypothetical protein